jgi:hypothetical protein
MLSNWGCSSSTGEDFTILSDALTAVVLPGNTFSVDSLLLPFLLMNSLFCLLAYISLRISWANEDPIEFVPEIGSITVSLKALYTPGRSS